MGDKFRDFCSPEELLQRGWGRGNRPRCPVSGLGQVNKLPKTSFDSSVKGDPAHLQDVR